jgi:hypothetical protein
MQVNSISPLKLAEQFIDAYAHKVVLLESLVLALTVEFFCRRIS